MRLIFLASAAVGVLSLANPEVAAQANSGSAETNSSIATVETELSGDFGGEIIKTVLAAYADGPIWTTAGTESLLAAKKDMFRHGLAADDANVRMLDQTVRRWSDGRALADDVALTAAWLRMASAVQSGAGQEMLSTESLADDLATAASGDADKMLDRYAPDHPQYMALAKTLKHYRELKSAGGWMAIPDGAIVEAGESDERIPALRERLAVEGYDVSESVNAAEVAQKSVSEDRDAAAPSEMEDPRLVFDEALAGTLKAFQRRHGLKDDGVIGPNTLAALNESPASKIDRVADTMMRWRVLGDPGTRYIWANIPSYMAEGWAGGERQIAMRTVVGKPSRETPVFSDEVEYIVANPKWYVPVSITRRDKAPKLARDPGYADRKNFRIFNRSSGAEVSAWDVDWTNPASARNYRLVQGPGEGNALGELKIIFPNQYSVYLHDTPSTGLFDRARRAFSSGCVRLEQPVRMARWLAGGDTDMAAADVEDALASGDRTRLNFSNEAAVHITYMTVTVGDDGQPYFWRDIYDRDDGIEYVERYASL